MPDFFPPSSGLTIGEIATLTGAEPLPGVPLDRRIGNIAALDTARARDISFLDDPKYLSDLAITRAGACLLMPRFQASAPQAVAVLLSEDPYRAFVTVARALFPSALQPSSLFGASGRAAGALIHASARFEAGVTVDPLAVIGPGVEIGAGSLIAPGAVIGPHVCVGRDCVVGPGATVLHALIGDRVVVQAGARIGQDGFSYLRNPQGHQKIPHIRRVIIQDDVEIGANTTVDRGSMRDTVIGEGTKIDKFVQIEHNVVIGRHCLIGGPTKISSGANVGDFVMTAAKVGIADEGATGGDAVSVTTQGNGT